MSRFYVNNINNADKTIVITGEDVNHIKNVLRLRVGDMITVGDGSGVDYECRISELSHENVIADIVDVVSNAGELKTRITLFQGMPKADKLDLIIQKAVELGVYEIIPVMTSRTVVKLDESKRKKKLERYNTIALSAAKQSGRGVVPEVGPFMSFKEAVEYSKSLDMNIIPYELQNGLGESRQIIKDIHGKSSLGIFIGPEGGFATEEVDAVTSIGGRIVTLGNRILRTETAGLATLAIIGFEIDED